MTRFRYFAVLPYLSAIGIVAAATLIRLATAPILKDRQPFAIFLFAVLITVRYCGLKPALLTLFLSAFAARYFFLIPRGSLSVPSVDQQASFLFFISFGLTFIFLMRAEQQSKQKLEREISERKQIEAELRATQDRFHSFVDNGPFLAFMKDEEERYVYVNRSCQKNWSKESSHWLGRTDYDLFSKEIAECYRQNDRLALQNESFVHFDETALTPDGKSQHWSTTKFPVQGENGRRFLGGISVEVTETRKAEQQAKESEARLLLALEAGRLGIWSWDIRTNRVQSSETQAAISGRSLNQTDTSLEESISNLHPDDKDLMQEVIERILKNQSPERITYRVIWADGSIHWIEAVGRVFCDESGKPIQVMGVCSDITERRRAENALRESEERFRLLAMHAPIGIAQSDAEGRTYFVNSKWCEIAGATPEESMVYGWQDFFHPEDRERLIESWHADMTAGKTHSTSEFRFIRKDGSIRWASSTASLIHDAHGIPIGQIGITEDITERKAAEDKLRVRESQLSGILDNTTAVVYLKDSEGRYLLTNRRYQNLFHQDCNDIVGKKDTDLFPDALAQKFLESDAQVWREQSPLDFEEVAPHPDGLHTYRSVKFPVRDETGRMIALGGISTDITDLKEAHEALKTEQELLRNLIRVQEKEKQLLCHEFHDGLIQYAIVSLMLLETYQNKHPATEASAMNDKLIGYLRKGVKDGRRVIRGVRPAVLDDSGLEAAIEDLIGQYSSNGISISSHCDPEIGRLPEMIQTTVYRVVQEALSNARKHSDTDVVRIDLKKVNGELRLEVRDFGYGFDVESARKKGFGLLSMTERVRLLGGDCLIQSERDSGTRISVRLPIPVAGDDN